MKRYGALWHRMGTLSFFCLFLTVVCMGPQASAFWQPVTTAKNVMIPTSDGIQLEGRLFRSRDWAENSRHPTILLISPWSVGFFIYEKPARMLAAAGYQVLAYNPRGWGRSGGEINTAGSLDMQDGREVIDWLIAERQADPQRIGASGVSLGAGMSLLLAAHDERVKAVASLSGWTDFLTAIYGNNTQRFVWDRILDISSAVTGARFPEGQQQLQQELIANRDLVALRDFTDERSPIHHLAAYRRHQTAIMISHNLTDYLFPARDLWRFYQALQTPKAIRLQPGVHASAELIDLVGAKDGIWRDVRQWFDRWLVPDGAWERQAADEVAVTLPHDSERTVLTKGDVTKVQRQRLYLASTPRTGDMRFGQLVGGRGNQDCCRDLEFSFWFGLNSGIPILNPLLDTFVPTPLRVDEDKIRPEYAALYQWSLKQPTTIAGIPRLHLTLEASAPAGQIVAHLFRVNEAGDWALLGLVPYTFFDQPPGEPFALQLDFFSGFAKLAPGDRLVLGLDTYDLQFQPLAERDYRLTIREDLETLLELPVVRD